jgi:hypothetical protein
MKMNFFKCCLGSPNVNSQQSQTKSSHDKIFDALHRDSPSMPENTIIPQNNSHHENSSSHEYKSSRSKSFSAGDHKDIEY